MLDLLRNESLSPYFVFENGLALAGNYSTNEGARPRIQINSTEVLRFVYNEANDTIHGSLSIGSPYLHIWQPIPRIDFVEQLIHSPVEAYLSVNISNLGKASGVFRT